jgi:hypothetical protein
METWHKNLTKKTYKMEVIIQSMEDLSDEQMDTIALELETKLNSDHLGTKRFEKNIIARFHLQS